VDGQNRVVVEVSPSSITDGEWDLLYAVAGQPVELYRAQEDIGHCQELSAANWEVVARLHGQYARWLEAMAAPPHFLAPRQALA